MGRHESSFDNFEDRLTSLFALQRAAVRISTSAAATAAAASAAAAAAVTAAAAAAGCADSRIEWQPFCKRNNGGQKDLPRISGGR